MRIQNKKNTFFADIPTRLNLLGIMQIEMENIDESPAKAFAMSLIVAIINLTASITCIIIAVNALAGQEILKNEASTYFNLMLLFMSIRLLIVDD